MRQPELDTSPKSPKRSPRLRNLALIGSLLLVLGLAATRKKIGEVFACNPEAVDTVQDHTTLVMPADTSADSSPEDPDIIEPSLSVSDTPPSLPGTEPPPEEPEIFKLLDESCGKLFSGQHDPINLYKTDSIVEQISKFFALAPALRPDGVGFDEYTQMLWERCGGKKAVMEKMAHLLTEFAQSDSPLFAKRQRFYSLLGDFGSAEIDLADPIFDEMKQALKEAGLELFVTPNSFSIEAEITPEMRREYYRDIVTRITQGGLSDEEIDFMYKQIEHTPGYEDDTFDFEREWGITEDKWLDAKEAYSKHLGLDFTLDNLEGFRRMYDLYHFDLDKFSAIPSPTESDYKLYLSAKYYAADKFHTVLKSMERYGIQENELGIDRATFDMWATEVSFTPEEIQDLKRLTDFRWTD